MTSWTTIPPWLYESDLPDDDLQALYVKGAEKKYAAAVADRERLEREVAGLRATRRDGMPEADWLALLDALAERYAWLGDAERVERAARAFLAQARVALARYRAQRRLARG